MMGDYPNRIIAFDALLRCNPWVRGSLVPTGPREKLVRLLRTTLSKSIRLDEKVVFQLSDYRLPDGTSFCIAGPEHRDLPGSALAPATMKDRCGSKWRASHAKNRHPRRRK